MVASYLTLSSQSNQLSNDFGQLNNEISVYSRYNSELFSDLSCENVIVIDEVTNPSITTYSITLPSTALAGVMYTFVSKITGIRINIFSGNGTLVTSILGVDICKIMTNGYGGASVFYNQSSATPVPVGYLGGSITITHRDGNVAQGFTNPQLSAVGLTYNVTATGLTIFNPENYTGTLQFDFIPRGTGTTDQEFYYDGTTVPPGLLDGVSWVGSTGRYSYGYSSNSMLAVLNMKGIPQFNLRIFRRSGTGYMEPSMLYITPLPYTLEELPDNLTTNYTPLVPQMTSDITPPPFIIDSTPGSSPAFHAFNKNQNGWISDDIEGFPEISVSCGSRYTPAVILIETLPLVPDDMNMTVNIYGSYRENAVDFLSVILVAEFLVGNTDGTSKTYEYIITEPGNYETFTFQITSYDSATSKLPGFKNIQIYTNSTTAPSVGGFNADTLPVFEVIEEGQKLSVPDSVTLPPLTSRLRYYYNQIFQNRSIIDYSGSFNIIDQEKTSNTIKYLGYNGPNTNEGVGDLDFCLKVGPHNMIYKSISIYDYTTPFRIALTSPTVLRGDVLPFSLVSPHINPNLEIFLSQNNQIMNFKNNTNKDITIGMYVSLSFKPTAVVPPKIEFFIQLQPFFYNITAAAYNTIGTTSQITNIYDTFTAPAAATSIVQLYLNPGGGDATFRTIDPVFNFGIITVY